MALRLFRQPAKTVVHYIGPKAPWLWYETSDVTKSLRPEVMELICSNGILRYPPPLSIGLLPRCLEHRATPQPTPWHLQQSSTKSRCPAGLPGSCSN